MVEDMHTNYWTSHVDTQQSFIELSKQMMDMLHEPYLGRKEINFRHNHPEAVGVDISYSMIENAEKHNKFGDRCEYRVNTTDDLVQLDDASFDFVYSNISLQHSPPEASSKYIAEFFRILRPGGVALFQIPSGPHHESDSLGARIYSTKRGPLRRFWKRIRGMPPVEIHYINQSLVEEIIKASGGRLIDETQQGSVRGSRISMLYCAVRE
jgi:ubiquinone/menaquinone biosynthesis C-methylase UbiE